MYKSNAISLKTYVIFKKLKIAQTFSFTVMALMIVTKTNFQKTTRKE